MDLRELRIDKNLTQEKAAELLGITRRTYINYEQGKVDLSKPRYSYIFDVLSQQGRIDETHGILSLNDIETICSGVFDSYSIDYAVLFGSYAKGKAVETSDVDLLVSMELDGTAFYDLAEQLREKLHKRIDLIHIKQLQKNLELTSEILKEGIRIYDQRKRQLLLRRKATN